MAAVILWVVFTHVLPEQLARSRLRGVFDRQLPVDSLVFADFARSFQIMPTATFNHDREKHFVKIGGLRWKEPHGSTKLSVMVERLTIACILGRGTATGRPKLPSCSRSSR